jgi:hypothetical protein
MAYETFERMAVRVVDPMVSVAKEGGIPRNENRDLGRGQVAESYVIL